MKCNTKELRDRMNLSQLELASKIGVHLSTVSNWETGLTMPSRLSLKKLEQLEDAKSSN